MLKGLLGIGRQWNTTESGGVGSCCFKYYLTNYPLGLGVVVFVAVISALPPALPQAQCHPYVLNGIQK